MTNPIKSDNFEMSCFDMGKHIDAKTKYHHVMRNLNDKWPTKLSLGINPQLRNLTYSILKRNSIYQKEGIKGFESKTEKKKGPNKGRLKKKPKPRYEDISKEELIERLRINDIFVDEINKFTRARFKYPVVLKIKEHFKISISKICEIINVSKSGHYSWLKSLKKKVIIHKDYWLKSKRLRWI